MIFFIGNDGTVIKSFPSPVYQGSVNANNIYVIAPFAENLTVTVAFRLPNGIITERFVMTPVNEIAGVTDEKTGKVYSGWQFSLPNTLTKYFGTVKAQFYFYAANGVLVASSGTDFQVGRGVPDILPEEPSADVYAAILSNISALQHQLNNGAYPARAIYAWNSAYSYGANEITYFPDVGLFGALVKSRVVDNLNHTPYNEAGELNSQYWEALLYFTSEGKAVIFWGFNQPADLSDLEKAVTFEPIAIDKENVVLPYKEGQYIVATQPFSDGGTTYQPGVYVDMLNARQQLTMTGPKGDKGDTGLQGEPGVSPTITIGKIDTLPAGSEATVENIGTDQNVILKFGIPQGAEGETGPEGATGEQGEPGAPGEKGERGFSGYIQCIGIAGTGDWSNHVLVQTSIDGNKGNQAGNYCLILDDNNASLNGSVVLLGVNDTGSNYYPYTVAGSLKGAKGDKGDTGANGEKGEPGEKGIKKFINSRYGFGKSELQSAATEGATYTWDILPSELEGVTVGDNVVIKVGVSDLGNSFNSYAFVFAKVTALNSGVQNLTTVSYGYVSTGEKGDIGPKGDKGDTGATGDPGATYSLNGTVLTIRFN